MVGDTDCQAGCSIKPVNPRFVNRGARPECVKASMTGTATHLAWDMESIGNTAGDADYPPASEQAVEYIVKDRMTHFFLILFLP